MKEYQGTIYESIDGLKFISKKECQKYEEKFLGKVQYFKVKHTPDLTETGSFTKVTYLAVLPHRYGNASTLAKNYALKVIGGGDYLIRGVQGSGFQANFIVQQCDRKAYDEHLGIGWGANPAFGEQVYVGVDEIPGFPKPFNYEKEWGLH